MKQAVFITGATGFLGQYLVKILSKKYKCFILVRHRSLERAKKIFADNQKVVCIEGDITEPDIFTYDKDIDLLNQYSLDIIHSAALYEFDASYADNYLLNVLGMQNLLAATRFLRNVRQMIHISTIAVAGDFSGNFTEDMLIEGQSFSNYYAKTKFDAEVIFHKFETYFQKVVVRPGVIVGDSTSGEFYKVDGIYYLLEFFIKLFQNKWVLTLIKNLPAIPLPYDKKAVLPLVAVNDVACFIGEVVNQPPKKKMVFHVTDMTYGCRVEDFYRWVLNKWDVDTSLIALAKSELIKKGFPLLKIPQDSVDYMYKSIVYDTQAVQEEYPDFAPTPFWDMADCLYASALKRWKK